jgi:hypothetical protein
MMMNVMQLFMCTVNYAKLFGELSDHMKLYIRFIQVLMPKVINVPDELRPSVERALENLGNMTPATYFQAVQEPSQILPKFREETLTDLQDIFDFYETPFRDLRLKRD